MGIAAQLRGRPFPTAFVFALIFCAIFLAHAPLLRLPYYWDEAGYYIPAARDLYLTGSLIPHSVPSNAHPPLVMAWLAMWWKLSGFTPAVTRTAMLLLAALGLTAVFRLAQYVMNTTVAVAATLCTALYPVWFAQSSMAHVDLAAAALGLWGLLFFVERRRALAVLAFSLAVLAKETAIIVPLALASWELLWWMSERLRGSRPLVAPSAGSLAEILSLLVTPSAVLAVWFAYHYHQTGYIFGNPEFFRYNVTENLHPIRVLLACVRRLWQAVGYMNLFVLTLAAAMAMMLPAQPESAEPGAPRRPRISFRVQPVFILIILVHVFVLAVIGGAVLARYMLMVVPLVIILCVSTLRRRVRGWPLVIAAVCGAFVVGLFENPPYRFAMEDNLAYRDYVVLHKAAADLLSKRYPNARVLTAWPATDELSKPFLGYVKTAMPVVPVENFSAPQIAAAARETSAYDVAYPFSTKYEPPSQARIVRWWERLQEPFFGFHRDLRPGAIAGELGGRIVWQKERKGQWAAVMVVERAQNASGNGDAVSPFRPARSPVSR